MRETTAKLVVLSFNHPSSASLCFLSHYNFSPYSFTHPPFSPIETLSPYSPTPYLSPITEPLFPHSLTSSLPTHISPLSQPTHSSPLTDPLSPHSLTPSLPTHSSPLSRLTHPLITPFPPTFFSHSLTHTPSLSIHSPLSLTPNHALSLYTLFPLTHALSPHLHTLSLLNSLFPLTYPLCSQLSFPTHTSPLSPLTNPPSLSPLTYPLSSQLSPLTHALILTTFFWLTHPLFPHSHIHSLTRPFSPQLALLSHALFSPLSPLTHSPLSQLVPSILSLSFFLLTLRTHLPPPPPHSLTKRVKKWMKEWSERVRYRGK